MIVGNAVGPFAQRRLDETLGLAVSLGPVGTGEAMLEFEGVTGLANSFERTDARLSVGLRRARPARGRQWATAFWSNWAAVALVSSGYMSVKPIRAWSS